MPTAEFWTDLIDPDEAAVRDAAPTEFHPGALAQLAAAPGAPRPTIESHGSYVLGVLLVPVAVPAEDTVFYQEVDFILTRDRLMTVRKTPPGRPAFDPAGAQEACRPGESAAMHAFHLVDVVAERYLDLTDALHEEIDELEEHVEDWPSSRIRLRLSELRHDLLHIRQALAPTRDAVRRVVDGRIDLEGAPIFTRDVELHFADAYDKLLQAAERLDLARDLVASVRDYHQAKIANDVNEVMKRLTAIASILFVPTFIVGLYGQNFIDGMPELRWGGWGYAWSWFLIAATTVLQVWYFRRKKWL